jgi:putative ABC transport system ATP-binding protein
MPKNTDPSKAPFEQASPSVATEAEVVFSVRALTKVYPMGEVEVHALRGIDLDLMAGEFVVVLGASGSGKSTLLNLLGGLDIPTSGTIRFRDHDLTVASEDERTRFRREHVGFVFQFYNLIAGLTAVENVALVADISPHPLAPAEALRLVGLSERQRHYPSQLSGGEQQRIAIARAIGKRPDILLCDEPTGALDLSTGVVVLEAIANVNRELGTLTVVITHNSSIAQMADRVVTMSDGRISQIQHNRQKKSAHELVW